MNQDQQNALEIHNRAREEVGSPPLMWSWQLVEEAQTWADYTAGKDLGEARSRLRMRGNDISETITTTKPPNPHDPLTATSSLWHAEKRYWHGMKILPYCEERCKHASYTQMVWNKTTHLGMASASDGNTTVVVARYWPPGNVVGERPLEMSAKGDGEFDSSDPVLPPVRNTRHPCV